MKSFIKFIIFPIIIFCFAWSFEVPVLSGRVNDYARILTTSEQQQLDDFLAEYEQKTSNQLVLLTLTSLEGESLEDFSIRTVDKWKLGQKAKDNGLLLLVVKNERKVRVEVGYGLEPTITDAFCGELIREVIAPSFQNGNYYQGIYDAFYNITEKIGGEFSTDRYSKPVYRVDQTNPGNISEGKLEFIFFSLIFFGVIMSAVKMNFVAKGFFGSFFLPLLAFMLLGIPFSLPLLIMLLIFGWPFTFLAIVLFNIFSAFGGMGGFYGGSSHGGSSFGGFSGGGGGFGGGGSSGSW